jgi:GH25 family lysozyme M1 (1,4-beta-N-acetylmuramidase)
MKKGIDVSAWQGLINWENVLMDGIQCAVLRAGYGKNGIDKQFHRNAVEARKAAISVSAYWFLYSLTVNDAAAEAEYAVQAVSKHFNETVIWADLEYDSVDYARKHGVVIGRELATAQAIAFCQRVSQLGYIPGVYTNVDYLNRYFDWNRIQQAVPGVKLWLACWSASYPEKFGKVDVWQYSSKGKVNGINGNVDMDKFYTEVFSKSSSVSSVVNVVAEQTQDSKYVVTGINYNDVFDSNFYAKKQTDVRLAVTDYCNKHLGSDKNAKLFEHFYYCGMTEHRQAHEDFDPQLYRKKYSDLDRAFGNDWKKYYDHYCLYGKAEGRSCK